MAKIDGYYKARMQFEQKQEPTYEISKENVESFNERMELLEQQLKEARECIEYYADGDWTWPDDFTKPGRVLCDKGFRAEQWLKKYGGER